MFWNDNNYQENDYSLNIIYIEMYLIEKRTNFPTQNQENGLEHPIFKFLLRLRCDNVGN